MVLSDERRAALLAYCRLDDLAPSEETLLETLYNGAVSYLEQAGIEEPVEGTPRRAQYDLCVNALVLDGYDRRGMTTPGASVQTNPAFRHSLHQLKLSEPVVSDSDTTGGGHKE